MNLKVNQINYGLIDQEIEFYRSLLRKWLDGNDILMYLTHKEGKAVVAERFIR